MRRPVLARTLALSVALALSAPVLAQSAAAPATAEAVQDESQRLNAWFATKYEEQLRFSPIALTFLGRKELYDRLDDMSEEAQDAQLAWHRASVEEMEASFDRDALDDEARLSYDLWKQQYEQAAAASRFRRNVYVFNQMQGAQSFLPTFLINFHKVGSEADYRAYIARLAEAKRAMGQLLEMARRNAADGYRMPRFAYDGVLTEARAVVTGAPFDDGADSALWADLQAKADALVAANAIDAARAAELKAEARQALLDNIRPAYDALIAWAGEDRANAAENPSGVGSTQPEGAAYYANQLRIHTTTDLDAEAIHRIGLDEVARIHGEMEALMERVGFEGDLKAFFRHIATDPKFKYPDTDEGRQAYIDDATRAIDNIKKVLPQYFGLLPKADLVVKRVEPFREQPGAAQHYFPGTPDGSRPGVYYAHLSDMNAMPKPELEVIAYHEGLPGHHMQISIAQELTGVPEFRTQARSTAYSEGWGLYAEWLAREMPGTYEDPYSEYGRLASELWRAVRLVVDTGLHAKGWTEQQAVDYFSANSATPEAAIRSEIQRYITWPGQATAYKIGMLRIQELRRKAESELGDRFDIRGFHDAVLGGGALPLNLLERRVTQWIEARKRG
ncbi:uncharacterized protein (DUF885 family) [Luteimonas sp. J16]|uniref:DUF885 domain-containing protein n=1 Tax=unclassified Luteimonas TaxID=2629088 RepID=UPI00047EBF9A|nr:MULTISPECIES: DUF885 domain-containing protein [unclassified Luteimonas]TWG91835.1 uncharacterized protein (DUF885 family) [Luteimonas sp. J16]